MNNNKVRTLSPRVLREKSCYVKSYNKQTLNISEKNYSEGRRNIVFDYTLHMNDFRAS